MKETLASNNPKTVHSKAIQLPRIQTEDVDEKHDHNNLEFHRRTVTEAIINDVNQIHQFSPRANAMNSDNNDNINYHSKFVSMYDINIQPKFNKSYIYTIICSTPCILLFLMLLLNIYLIILSIFYGVGEITTLEFSDFWCEKGIFFVLLFRFLCIYVLFSMQICMKC